jgi:hypothetical protein
VQIPSPPRPLQNALELPQSPAHVRPPQLQRPLLELRRLVAMPVRGAAQPLSAHPLPLRGSAVTTNTRCDLRWKAPLPSVFLKNIKTKELRGGGLQRM